MKKVKGIVSVILAVVLIVSTAMVFTSCGSGNSDETVKFVIGTAAAESTNTGKALAELEKNIEEATDGRIDVQVQYSGVIGDETDMIEQVQMGTIQMTLPSSSLFTAYGDEFAIWDVPFLFNSYDAIKAAYNGELGEEYASWMADNGFYSYGIIPTGFRGLSNSKHTVTSPSDMNDLKIRVMESTIYVDTFNALSANTVTMNYSEVYSGLQQGVIDGQDNPAEFTVTSGFYELNKYYTRLNHTMCSMPVVGSVSFMESLDDDLRAILEDEIDEFIENLSITFEESEQGYIDQMADAGVEITELSDKQMQVFRDAVSDVYDKWGEKIGNDVIDLALSYN